MKRFLAVTLSVCVGASMLCAQDVISGAEIIRVDFPHANYFTALSDNGLWAAVSGNDDENDALSAYPYLCNATTGELIQLWEGNNYSGVTAMDVTNDGKIVVGSHNGPAYYDVDAGAWVQLPGAGAPIAVTPDGSRIAGWSAGGTLGADNYGEQPVIWDRQADGTYRQVDVYSELPNFPRTDKNGSLTGLVRIENMSADGNILAGAINFVYPQYTCYYVYNCTTHEVVYLDNLMGTASGSFIDQSNMSNDGSYIAGLAYVAEGNEYTTSYRYNIKTGEMVLYNTFSDEQDRGAYAVSNNGTVFGSSPAVNPLRYVYVRAGNLWYGIDEIVSGRYGMNIYQVIGQDYTGTTLDVSDDERVMLGMSMGTGNGYIVRLPESFSDAASHIDPFDAYAVNPAAGSSFARFRQATITFAKPTTLAQATAQAPLLDANGNQVYSFTITANADGVSFTVGGRPQTLTPGATYTLLFPAGTFMLTADNSFTNDDIRVNYVGRENVPTQATSISPDNGANVSELSTNNPVRIIFDLNIQVATDTDGNAAVGYLYEEGNETALCELVIAASGRQIAMAPSLRRYLRSGVDYRVVLPAGSVTDIMGDCANEEISISYHGVYEPTTDPNSADLYYDDFNDPSRSMVAYLLYEGDHNNPSSVPQSWGFDADNNPWNFTIRSTEETSDYCVASHSMYNPAGQSNDWMSLEQLYIENANYYLSFDAQSYLQNKNDVLEVIVLVAEEGYTNFTDEMYNRFVNEGVKIFEKQVTPGSSQEGLEGDWQSFELSLADFAGKSIYIAFVNRNQDQSAIFLDNVRVFYQGDFMLVNNTASTVVNAASTKVSARLSVTGEDVYDTLTATLSNADGFTSTYTAQGLALSKTSASYSFEFPQELPLNVGVENSYTITIDLDGERLSRNGVVKNLAFATTKHVVVEKATGQPCRFCPSGILAFEYMSNLFGDKFIPIAIHSNLMGSDLYAYDNYVSYIGASALPSGMVNRIDTLYSAMATSYDLATNSTTYSFNSATGNTTWLDIAQREFEQNGTPEADVIVDRAYCDNDNRIMGIEGKVNYALTLNSVNQSLVFVILENQLPGNQLNAYYTQTDPIFGAFGAGGDYGSNNPAVVYDHVARYVIDEAYGGLSGFIPVSVTANLPVSFTVTRTIYDGVSDWNNAELVAMLVDNNTGLVINATKVPFVIANSVKSSLADSNIGVRVAGGEVTVVADATLDVALYDMSGRIVKAAKGSDEVTLRPAAGIYIVKATTAGNTVVKKVVVK